MELVFRASTQNDKNDILHIFENAKVFMRQQGLVQWQNGYPNMQSIEEDILLGQSYLLEVDKSIAGTLAICYGVENAYNTIYDGAWLSNKPYAAIHRVAVDESYRGQGISTILLQNAENLILKSGVKSIRIDTHPDNIPMQRFLEKNGYTKCGTIYLAKEHNPTTIRIGFEKLL